MVPADPKAWSVHPFSGEIRDGVLWGRGAVDMKNADAVLLAVVSQWARSGIRPQRDIVLAFTADEEDTAEFGARWLVERHPELFEGCTEAIGESGAFTFHAGPGQRLYPIASAERGIAWLKLTARGQAGHGAKPNDANAVIRLAEAITRIGAFRWPVRLTPTVRAAVEAIAASAGTQLPDGALTGGLTAEELLARLGPAGALVAGTVRNSANPTMLQAGYKINVIPGEAVGYVDGRVLPGYEAEFRASLDELTGAKRCGLGVRARGDTAGSAARRSGDGQHGPGPAGRGPRLDHRALLHERRHRRQAVLPARHDLLRLHPAGTAGRL